MSTLLAAVFSAVTALSVSLISASRKAPEDRIVEPIQVLEKASPSEWQSRAIRAAIDREYERLETPDFSSWLLGWSVAGAIGLGFFSLVPQAHSFAGSGELVRIAAFGFIAIFLLLLVAVFLQELRRTRRWWRARNSEGHKQRDAASDGGAGPKKVL